MGEYSNNLFNLLYDGYDWNREKTIEGYKQLDKILWCGELNIKACNYSDLSSALKNMSDLLYSEATMKEKGAEEEARDTIVEIAKKLKLLTPEQQEIIVNRIYVLY
jgi:hypothetical protein